MAFVGDSFSAPLSGGWTTNLMASPELVNWTSTNVAVGGYRTAWMVTNLYNITNWLQRALPEERVYCTVIGGYNDLSYGTNLADIQANLLTMWETVTNVGAIPVVGTIWQKTNDPAGYCDALNAWIRSNYTAYGAMLLDLAKIIDPAQGMTYDGLHPGAVGNAYIANAVLQQILNGRKIATEQSVGTNAVWMGAQAPVPLYFGTGGKTNAIFYSDTTIAFPSGVMLYSPTGGVFKLVVDDAGVLKTTRVH